MATGVLSPVKTNRSTKFVVSVDADAGFELIPTIASTPKTMAMAVEKTTARRKITIQILRYARSTAMRG